MKEMKRKLDESTLQLQMQIKQQQSIIDKLQDNKKKERTFLDEASTISSIKPINLNKKNNNINNNLSAFTSSDNYNLNNEDEADFKEGFKMVKNNFFFTHKITLGDPLYLLTKESLTLLFPKPILYFVIINKKIIRINNGDNKGDYLELKYLFKLPKREDLKKTIYLGVLNSAAVSNWICTDEVKLPLQSKRFFVGSVDETPYNEIQIENDEINGTVRITLKKIVMETSLEIEDEEEYEEDE